MTRSSDTGSGSRRACVRRGMTTVRMPAAVDSDGTPSMATHCLRTPPRLFDQHRQHADGRITPRSRSGDTVEGWCTAQAAIEVGAARLGAYAVAKGLANEQSVDCLGNAACHPCATSPSRHRFPACAGCLTRRDERARPSLRSNARQAPVVPCCHGTSERVRVCSQLFGRAYSLLQGGCSCHTRVSTSP